MEITIFYAIAVGCLLTTLFLICIAPSFLYLLRVLSFLITKHLTYPYLWGRHRLIAPCTRVDALSYLAYAVTNVFLVVFKTPSIIMARDRAGTLSVINMSFLFLAHHLGFLANAMGISLMTCKRIHRAVGWMTGMLLGLYIIMAMITDRKSWILCEKPNLFVLIVYYRSRSTYSVRLVALILLRAL